jgi:hypothetical protein
LPERARRYDAGRRERGLPLPRLRHIENRAHHVRDRILHEDDSRVRQKPGIFARLRSFALNILRADGISNVSEAIYTNALSLDRLLAYGEDERR